MRGVYSKEEDGAIPETSGSTEEGETDAPNGAPSSSLCAPSSPYPSSYSSPATPAAGASSGTDTAVAGGAAGGNTGGISGDSAGPKRISEFSRRQLPRLVAVRGRRRMHPDEKVGATHLGAGKPLSPSPSPGTPPLANGVKVVGAGGSSSGSSGGSGGDGGGSGGSAGSGSNGGGEGGRGSFLTPPGSPAMPQTPAGGGGAIFWCPLDPRLCR